jgi:NTE family protein
VGAATLGSLPDRPVFVFNTTNLKSGTRWPFPGGRVAGGSGRGVANREIRVADAVAASSAFPPYLSPARPRMRNRPVLTDGGVYDNLGLETAWKACRTVLVSDAGGQMAAEPDPDHDWGRHLFRVLGVIDNQVRSLRKRQCVQAFISGERLGAYWGIRTDIADFGLDDPLPAPHEATTALAMISTRLARLDEVVQERLVNWGYAACDAGLRRHVDTALPAPAGYPYPAAGVA